MGDLMEDDMLDDASILHDLIFIQSNPLNSIFGGIEMVVW